jgi:hypothetical protein
VSAEALIGATNSEIQPQELNKKTRKRKMTKPQMTSLTGLSV